MVALMVSVTAVCATGAAGAAVAADESDQLSTEAAASIVAAHEESISGSAAPLTLEESNDAWTSAENRVEIQLPTDPAEPISVESPMVDMRITLPSSDSAGDAEPTESGLLGYDNNDGSFTVPIPGDAGELQVNTVIESPDAPAEYEYGVQLPTEARLERVGDALVYLGTEDQLLLMVGAPWAKDAEGRDVPTHYEVGSGTITQIIEHNSTFAYPIVADPWFGWTLFHEFKGSTYNGQKKYSAWVTPAARIAFGNPFQFTGTPPRAIGVTGAYANWVTIMRSAGWAEWKVAWPKITDKASVKQQFDCHVAAGSYGVFFTGAYDLERSRPNRTDGNWQSYVASHRCNWKYATGSARE